jgi:DNA-binding transcriptional ArsR family regulator
VNELASHLDVQPSAVSQHLAKLRLALLVTTRREGNRVVYVIADRHLERLVAEAFRHAGMVSTDKATPRRRAAPSPGLPVMRR